MRILKHRKTDRARAVNRKRHADNAERQKLHVSKGDTVRVVRGDDKGKEGKIIRVYPKTGRVIIEELTDAAASGRVYVKYDGGNVVAGAFTALRCPAPGAG